MWELSTFLAVLPVGLLFAAGADRYVSAICIMSVALALSCAALVNIVRAPTTRPIAFTAFIYLVFFYVLPGIVHLATNRFPFFDIGYDVSVANSAATIILLFVVCFVVGLWLGRGRSEAGAPAPSTGVPSLETMILLVGGLCALSATAGVLVGFDYLQTRRGDLAQLFETPSPRVLMLAASARIGSFLALLLAAVNAVRRPTLPAIALVVPALALFLLTNNPLSIPRFVVGSYALTALFVFAQPDRRMKALLVIGAVLAQFTIFPLLSELARGDGPGGFLLDPLAYISTHGDFDGFQSTMNVVALVNAEGFSMGRQIVSAILFFVPRELFPSKSVGTGGEAALFMDYPFINISAPIPSELYVDFGIPGLLPMALAVGWGVARLDRVYARCRAPTDPGRILPALVAGYIIILFRGSLIGVLGPFALSVGLALGIQWMLARHRRSPAAGGR